MIDMKRLEEIEEKINKEGVAIGDHPESLDDFKPEVKFLIKTIKKQQREVEEALGLFDHQNRLEGLFILKNLLEKK